MEPKSIPCPPDVLRSEMLWVARECAGLPIGVAHLSLWEKELRPAQLRAIYEHAQAGHLSIAEPAPGELHIFPDYSLFLWWESESEDEGKPPNSRAPR